MDAAQQCPSMAVSCCFTENLFSATEKLGNQSALEVDLGRSGFFSPLCWCSKRKEGIYKLTSSAPLCEVSTAQKQRSGEQHYALSTRF